MRLRGTHGRGDRGAVAVEFALVLPVFLLLVFGAINFGFIFNDWLSLTQGVQAGARGGAVGTYVFTPASCSLDTPSTGSTQAAKLMCLTHSRIGLTRPDVRVMVCTDGGARTCGNNAAAYGTNGRLAVCAMYPVNDLTGLMPFLGGGVIRSRTVVKVETKGGTQDGLADDLVTTYEAPLPGQDWSWCKPT